VPTVLRPTLTEKHMLPARVVQTGKVLRISLYVNDIEQEAVIAMNIYLLN